MYPELRLPRPGGRPRLRAAVVGRCALVGAIALVLSGYVVPPAKVLEKWARERSSATSEAVVEIPVRWVGSPGRLYVGGPRRNALTVEGGAVWFDGAAPGQDPLASLWLAMDLWSVSSAQDLGAVLEAVGVDLGRAGYARSRSMGGDVAHTVGSRGEGEGGVPQLWFSRSPLWPCRVVLPGSSPATIGPPGIAGWPAWVLLGEDQLLEITGRPVRAPTPPAWARPAAPAVGESFPENWRRAFGGPER